MKTIKVEIKKGHEIELELPAYFSFNGTMEAYIKIDSKRKIHHMRFRENELLYDIGTLSIDYVVKNYIVLDQVEGLGIWESAVMELKERINSL